MTVLVIDETHRAASRPACTRRRPSNHPQPKHASARRGRCRAARRDHADAFPQVTSGFRPFAAQGRVGSSSYNDPLNKTDPLGLRPGDDSFSDITPYVDPCGRFATQNQDGTYGMVGLYSVDGVCGTLIIEGDSAGPLNPAEYDYCANLLRAEECMAINQFAGLARRTAANEFGSPTDWSDYPTPTYGRYANWPADGSPGNAFQHILWSGLISARFGPAKAKQITDMHETTPEWADQEMHRQMDFANNHYGRELAASIRPFLFDSFKQRAKDFVQAGLACSREQIRPGVYEGPFVAGHRCGL